jgi:type II secretory pathway component PulC
MRPWRHAWFWALICHASFAAADGSGTARDPAADGSMVKLRVTRKSLQQLYVDPKLALEVNAGVIPRAKLRAELARGVPRFLRQVRTEAAFSSGRFQGWRVLELFPKRPDVQVLVLRVGDTVQKVNGHSVERPEEFQKVWDTLANAHELVLDIQRDGQASKLRYTIAD